MSLSSRMLSQILSMKKFAAVIPAGLVVALAACSPSPTATSGSSMAPASSTPASGAATVSISGEGASAPSPLYDRWFKEFNTKNPNVQISYQSKGSAAGVKAYLAKTVDFGATDSALKKDEKEQFPADRGQSVQVPSTGLFVVFAYNLDGVKSVKLSRETYCGIADGSIKKWNDEKIKKDNAGATLPDIDVKLVYRSDGSGTTAIFTKHLEKACPNWKAGSGKTIEWTPDATGAKGNEGVTALIKQTKGAIGYTEYSFAKQNGLEMATLQNKAGEFVAPTPESAAKALSGVKMPEDFSLSVPDPEAKEAYPIVSLTWLLFYTKYEDAAKADALKRFTKWALTEGKASATELGYIPLPEDVVTKVNAAVDTIGK